jgi:hypothetical protein
MRRGFRLAGGQGLRRKKTTDDWPAFDASLLQEVSAAFLRRRKSMKYRFGLSCERGFSETATGTFERLDLNTDWPLLLGLSIWEDGELCLDVRLRPTKRQGPWVFKDSFYGDVNDVSGKALVQMVERTLSVPRGVDPEREKQKLREVWARVRPHRT